VQCAPVRGFVASRILRGKFSCFPSQGVARRARPAFCSERQENFAKNPVTPPRPVALCTYDAEASPFNNKKKEQIMGLDIYAYTVPEGEEKHPLRHHFHYWRKHDGLLQWCDKLAKARGEVGVKDSDSGFIVTLTRDDLDLLEEAIEDGELNTVTRKCRGYSFDWKPHDLSFITKAQLVFALHRSVVISGDW
jgi:hypothetical protein